MKIKSNPIDQIVPSISELRALFNGRVIAPDDPRYEQARTVFYGGVDRHPAAIVRVADAGDVSRLVSVAREAGIELAIRSGGHSGAGHSTTEGGIVLDLSGDEGSANQCSGSNCLG